MIRVLSIVIGATLVAGSSVAMAKTLWGTDRNDTLVGTPNADRIAAFDGDDALYSGAGDDRLDGGAGKDHIWAGAGNDIVIGGPAGDLALTTPPARHERIFGGAGNDVIVVRVPGSVAFAGSGDDRIDARDPQTECPVPQNRPLAAVGRHAVFRPLDIPHCSNVVNTGPGANFVRADDGNLDVISCLGRRDRVIIDQYDRVGPECDILRRVNRYNLDLNSPRSVASEPALAGVRFTFGPALCAHADRVASAVSC